MWGQGGLDRPDCEVRVELDRPDCEYRVKGIRPDCKPQLEDLPAGL